MVLANWFLGGFKQVMEFPFTFTYSYGNNDGYLMIFLN